MMTRSRARHDVLAYVESAARRYCSRTSDEPEEIAQRILARVSDDVRRGIGPWDNVVASIRQAIADIARFDRRAKRCCNLPTQVAHSGIIDRGSIADQERIELRLDIDACLAREGESVRRLCLLLETMSLAEASRAMDVPRRTLRGWLASLRERMEARGFGEE